MLIRYGDIPLSERGMLNFASFHWRFEARKPLGRLLIDLSNNDKDEHIPLNGGQAKETAIIEYGKVEHPTILSMIGRWKAYLKENKVRWVNAYLSNDDIEQAFPRINYQPHTAMLLCAVAQAATSGNPEE
jgi:hypothetical protein